MKRAELFRLFEVTADGAYVVGEDQRLLYLNSAGSRLLGREPEDVIGRLCYDIIVGDDYAGHTFCRKDCPTIQSVRRGKCIPSYDVLSRTSDGRDLWLNVSVITVPDPEGSGRLAVHVFRDITSRRKAELLAQQTIATVSQYAPGSEEGAVTDAYPAPLPLLTRRELEVLRLVASGMRDARIAQILGIRPTTVRNHIEHILGKLGVHSRLEAVVFAAQRRLV